MTEPVTCRMRTIPIPDKQSFLEAPVTWDGGTASVLGFSVYAEQEYRSELSPGCRCGGCYDSVLDIELEGEADNPTWTIYELDEGWREDPDVLNAVREMAWLEALQEAVRSYSERETGPLEKARAEWPKKALQRARLMRAVLREEPETLYITPEGETTQELDPASPDGALPIYDKGDDR